MFKFWEYQISFKDPASVYSYHLFAVHHDIIWFLIIILVLVYWVLYKIVKDFNWKIFNNQNGVILFLFNYFIKWLEIFCIFIFYKIFIFLFRLFEYSLDISEILKLGVLETKINIVVLSFTNNIIKLFKLLFGFKKNQLIYPNNLIDSRGKILFDEEIYLFDNQYLHTLVEDFLKWKLTIKDIENLVNDRYVSSLTYHYTSNGFFFDGCINIDHFLLLKSNHFNKNNDLGLINLFSVMSLKLENISLIDTAFIYDEFIILRDSFFESLDFKHSLSFEFIWAIFPTTIILFILVPSLYLLYSLDEDLDPQLTIKVIGHQWYWSYEFNNWIELNYNEGSTKYSYYSFNLDSNIVTMDNLEFGTKRLLEVDKRLVIPVNMTIRFLVTSGDVLHSWAVPELGIKIDAVPGRLNQFLAFVTYPGVYYGQCSEICGTGHGFMPIVVWAVPYINFVKWLDPEIKFINL